ncbi:hypothetical protein [Fibrella aquatica]|uniref:hypothetical protein n=1 Tax=Fibrella aquatica TaxID=3242487 RepID=UPI0035219463
MKKIKRLDYTLIAEGFAEYAFISTYLRVIAEGYNVQAVQSQIASKNKRLGKSRVLSEAGKFCTAAITEDHNLVLVGVDLDRADHQKEQLLHKAECKKLSEAMGRVYIDYGDIIVLYVPVQAIEHWLAYQAYKINLIDSITANGVESRPQSELKKVLYRGKEDQFTIEKIAKEIAKKADFDELAKQSRSFCHFHEQVRAFLISFSH